MCKLVSITTTDNETIVLNIDRIVCMYKNEYDTYTIEFKYINDRTLRCYYLDSNQYAALLINLQRGGVIV